MSDSPFMEGAHWDGKRYEIYFHFELPRKEGFVICRVPSETLRDCYGASNSQKNELLKTFNKHRREIEEVARRLIQAGRYEKDRTILIRAKDAWQ